MIFYVGTSFCLKTDLFCAIILYAQDALVAQWIEQWPPTPRALVRFQSGVPFFLNKGENHTVYKVTPLIKEQRDMLTIGGVILSLNESADIRKICIKTKLFSNKAGRDCCLKLRDNNPCRLNQIFKKILS